MVDFAPDCLVESTFRGEDTWKLGGIFHPDCFEGGKG